MMKMKSYLLGVVTACLAIISFNVSAALLSVDWLAPDDNLITRDTDAGLEWLDLTVTANRSYNDINSQLGLGGEFEGWSYASSAQIEGLFDAAGGVAPYTATFDVSQNTAATKLLVLWGTIVPTDGTSILASAFYHAESSAPDRHDVGAVSQDPVSLTGFLATSFLSLGDDVALFDTGSALVRTSVVPVPAAVWLFGTAMIGLVGFGKRRKAA